ncbi:MAG: type II toxin-antitoxin system HicB family antitoxin [Proteobacteria bacterium]|nr:type II toxin-antitoxin system HicB family antitoxin [Pseudomonadota bacterium]
MTNYIALLHKAKKTYGIMFPDFPGCVSAGNTVEEALREGAEALSLHAEGLLQDEGKIPEARTLEEIKAARENWIDWDGAMVAVVPLLPPPGKKVRVSFTIDQNLLTRVDAVTNNRSGFFERGAQELLDK